MKKKKLIYQLFPSYLVIILIVVIASILLTNRTLQDFYYNEKADDLEARAILVGHEISADVIEDENYLTKICQDLGLATGTRITIISPIGIVLGDSHENPETMDNHGDRPEIITAYRGEKGTSVRYSFTLEQEMMYLAIPVTIGEKSVIVRTSLPITSLQKAISNIRERVLLGGIIILFFATLFIFFISRRIARPLEEMKQGAIRFANGDLDHKLTVPRIEEIGTLANALNKMAKQLDMRIKTTVQQRNEQEAILSNMVEGVFAIDNEERIISVNAAAADLLDLDRFTALNQPIHLSYRNTKLYQFIQKVLSSQNHHETELELSSPTYRYLKVTGTSLTGESGNQIGALIVLNDFTKIRQLENIRREFVANVSHELKTPITSIKGFVETILDEEVSTSKEFNRFMDAIVRQTERLNDIVDDLLELSRIEETEERRDISLDKELIIIVLESAIQDCQDLADRKKTKINIECDAKLTIAMNAHLLIQAIINLIDNAIKYSNSGQDINVSVEQKDYEVVIAVQDFGIGIDEKHFERLFERFYRVDKARSRKLGGTGLGLAIVKHIAKIHGGSVSVASTLGEGSTFSIHLPK